MTPERLLPTAPAKSTPLYRSLILAKVAGTGAVLLSLAVLLDSLISESVIGKDLPLLPTLVIFAIMLLAAGLVWWGARLLKAAEAERLRFDSFNAGQRDVLERIAAGAPLPEVLERIVRLVEAQAGGMVCSILLLDAQRRLRSGAAPSLPLEYNQWIDGKEIGPEVGSCGSAAFRAEQVIVEDIATHPYWAPYKELALVHGLRACWSSPIFSPQRTVLGTFAMYYREPRGPQPRETAWVDAATHLAAIAICRDQAAQALQQSEARYRQIVDTTYEGVWLIDAAARTTFANRRMAEMLGCTPEEMLGRSMFDYMDEAGRAEATENFARRQQGVSEQHEFRFIRRDGSDLWTMIAASPVSDEHGRMTSALGMVTDITKRKRADEERARLEEQLRQAQKLQSLGTLAGGIAHDFNNILTAISGNTQLAISDLPRDHAAQISLAEIGRASDRAADLVRQILAFSRPQAPRRKVVKLPVIAAEALRLLRASLPASVEIRIALADDAPTIAADSTQIHQVIMNLGTNAAHAIGDCSGWLEFQVAPCLIDAELARTSPDLHEGQYARLTVRDSGSGMDAATLARIFEPFFTTKNPGQGTGLGLSVVHGIMKGHGGAITAQSQTSEGATFHLYFPAAPAGETEAAPLPPTLTAGNGERILYVDDEERLVFLARRGLERLGYSFTGLTDPIQALAVFRANPAAFDLVVTDLTMPGLTGLDFAAEILRLRPGFPVILTTGYFRSQDTETAQRLGICDLIPKPATMDTLSGALRAALSRGDKAGPP